MMDVLEYFLLFEEVFIKFGDILWEFIGDNDKDFINDFKEFFYL